MQGLDRGVAILDAISDSAGRGLTLSEVSDAAELGRSTTYRFLRALEQLQLIEYESKNKRFFSGIKLVTLAMSAMNRFNVVKLARAHLKALAEVSGDTVYLFVRVNNQAVTALREEGDYPIRAIGSRVGDRRPFGAGAAPTALISFVEDEEAREELLAKAAQDAEKFGLDLAALREQVNACRTNGYAYYEDPRVPEMCSMAMPVLTDDGFPIAAVSIATIKSRMDAERRVQLKQWLTDTTADVATEVSRWTTDQLVSGLEDKKDKPDRG